MISRTKKKGRVWRPEELSPLAAVRTKAGFSREEAAVYLRVSSRSLSFYENGQRNMTLDLCEDMAKLYNVPFDVIRQAVADSIEEAKNGKPFEKLNDRAVIAKAVAEADNLKEIESA